MLRRFFKCLRMELKCIWKTKLIWKTVISLLVFSGLLAIIHCNYTSKWAYREYNNKVKFVEELEYHRQQKIQEGTYDFEEMESEVQKFRNEIEESKQKVANAMYVESPEYRTTYVLEQSRAYMGLIAVIIGASIMVSDYKNNTLRHKVLRFGKINYIASKVVIALLMSIFSVVTLVLLGEIEGACVYGIVRRIIPLSIKLPSITLASGILVKGSIIILDTFIYILIGAIIGSTFKSIIPAIIFEISEILFYVHAKYTPTNILMNLMDKYFDFVGNVKLESFIKISMPAVAIYLVALVIILIGTLTLINRKRSAYK